MRTNILLIAILGMVAAPAMAGKDNCSPEMTRGYWAFSCEGYTTTLPPAAPALVPARFFGTCDADRTAYFDCEGTYNVGGQVVPVTASGQGTTDKDGTGTITYNEFIAPNKIGELTIRYTVLDGGDTIWGMPVGNALPRFRFSRATCGASASDGCATRQIRATSEDGPRHSPSSWRMDITVCGAGVHPPHRIAVAGTSKYAILRSRAPTVVASR